MTGIVMFIGNRPDTRDGCPQAGHINARNGPEENETPLVDEFQRLGGRRNPFRWRQVEGPCAMRLKFFQIDGGHVSSLSSLHRRCARRQVYSASTAEDGGGSRK